MKMSKADQSRLGGFINDLTEGEAAIEAAIDRAKARKGDVAEVNEAITAYNETLRSFEEVL